MKKWMFVWMLLPAAVSASAAVERRLYSDRVDSSSFLWNDWNKFQENYHPLYAVDGDPATAWIEGAASSGEGEWIRFNLSRLSGTTALRLRIRNGYQKSSSLYKANARPQQVTVKLLPSGVTTTATLSDSTDWQELRVEQPAGVLEAVELRVVSAYKGTKYTDLGVSDVEFYATSTTPDNPAAEKARYDRVVAWKKERLAAAALFKTSTTSKVPLASAYQLRAEGPSPIPDSFDPGNDVFGAARAALDALAAYPGEAGLPRPDASITRAKEALANQFVGYNPVQAVATDTRSIPALDGLAPANLWNCFDGPPVWGDEDGSAWGSVELPITAKIGFLRAETVGTFAVSDNPSVADALAAKSSRCNQETPHTFAWARLGAATATTPARVETLLTVTCGTIDAREGREKVAVAQIVSYDSAGRLDLLVGERAATSFGWRGEGADAVLSEARRVGLWTSVVRAREGTTTP